MHQNLLPNNNDAQSTTKCGFLLRPDAQIVALCANCTPTARALRLRRPHNLIHIPMYIQRTLDTKHPTAPLLEDSLSTANIVGTARKLCTSEHLSEESSAPESDLQSHNQRAAAMDGTGLRLEAESSTHCIQYSYCQGTLPERCFSQATYKPLACCRRRLIATESLCPRVCEQFRNLMHGKPEAHNQVMNVAPILSFLASLSGQS